MFLSQLIFIASAVMTPGLFITPASAQQAEGSPIYTGDENQSSGNKTQAVKITDTEKIYTYTHEIVKTPLKWKLSKKTADLGSSDFYYGKQNGTDCKSKYYWARVTVAQDIAPCWTPEDTLFKYIKPVYISGKEGKFYRGVGVPGQGADFISGGSVLFLTLDINQRCYTMKFLTCDRWITKFYPDFMSIINGFEALK